MLDGVLGSRVCFAALQGIGSVNNGIGLWHASPKLLL